MFNKDEKTGNIKEAETIIGPSVKVKGNFHGQGNIIIEGSVEGSVKTAGFLLIGDKAIISANVEASEARIAGTVTGKIKIKGFLEITSSAKLNGDIQTAKISIEKGASLNGNLNMNNEHAPDKK
ncbi:polymer-forming cytoskeletal protein [bacterium]|nr:polymer-forming cytoskeletal protein [bacterium]